MYVFGGRDVDKRDLGDLIALKLPSKWVDKFSPRARPSHTTSSSAMVRVAKQGARSKKKVGSYHGF
jgi:hypothetical protein